MSSEYILECAKEFEKLFSQTNERLSMGKKLMKNDLLQIKGLLT